MPSNPPSAGPARRSFALTGPSTKLDPRTNAVRRDIADIRLAEHVFAPHYAAPLSMVVATETVLRSERPHDSTAVAILLPDDLFEVLEYAGDDAWGIAPGHGQVGYIAAAALAPCVS
ncbi:MAG: SH3 domain-containing protein [Pseudomonadota bacterium]|uniref:SH3 domain-containing protein n=1 Tax=Sphingomonas sp. ERG5 TaxID=1381597 RepID=UPI000ACACE07|nr:SH3 domain-containing protein [Sphingomonas sp. ERG5]